AHYSGTGRIMPGARTYSFPMTDSNGCMAATSGTIAEPPVLNPSSSATPILCNGGSSTVTVSATGGTAPYTGTGMFSHAAGTYSSSEEGREGSMGATRGTIAEPSVVNRGSAATANWCKGGS